MRGFDADIQDVKIIEPTIFEDERGYFLRLTMPRNSKNLLSSNFCQTNELFKEAQYEACIFKRATCPVKIGEGYSRRNSDVIVDCRRESHTVGKYVK